MHDISLSQSELARLLGAADGDAALIFLYLRSGGDAAGAATALRLPAHRLDRAKLTLTPAGRALAEQLYCRVDSAVAGGGQGLTPQQRETLYAAMNIIIDNLSRYLAQREE